MTTKLLSFLDLKWWIHALTFEFGATSLSSEGRRVLNFCILFIFILEHLLVLIIEIMYWLEFVTSHRQSRRISLVFLVAGGNGFGVFLF